MMGHDVTPIGQHGIDTSSIQIIANQLSERFKATVIYGYTDDWIDKNYEGSFEFIEQGRVAYPSGEVYCLKDCYYMDRIYESSHRLQNIWFEFYNKKYPNDFLLSIHETTFLADVCFNNRWLSFCKYFTGEQQENSSYLDYINEFRKKVQNQVIQMGGKAAVYGDDQGESAWLDYGAAARWEEMLSRLQREYGDRFISISLFIKNKAAFHKDTPLAFYDDFADLED